MGFGVWENTMKIAKAGRLAGWAAALVAVGFSAECAAAESRSWMVGWFTFATYSQEGDCSKGINPSIYEVYRSVLKNMGKTPQEIDTIFSDIGNGGPPSTQEIFINRGRIDGKPVNIYDNPLSAPDPKFNEVDGKYAFGFNLDGKTETGYEDPVSHERGVDNQYYRALGCNQNHRAFPPDRPTHAIYIWNGARDSSPAWIITVKGEDLDKDGEVTVMFDRALKHATLDATGNVVADATFRIDPSPRSHNELKGRIKDGTIYIDGGDLNILGDPFNYVRLQLANTHARFKMLPNGALEGILGGYQPWMHLYFSYSSHGYVAEVNESINYHGVYHALRRLADAHPDPKTGENTAISVAYRVEAVRAFTLPAEPVRSADAR